MKISFICVNAEKMFIRFRRVLLYNVTMLLIDKFDFSLFSLPKIKLHIRYLIPLLFAGKNFVIVIDGIKVLIRPRTFDLYIVAEIFLENSYLIPQLKGKTLENIIDLGANIGVFTLWAAKNYSPKKIVSVEMESENASQLNKNIKNNSETLNTEFKVVNKAVYSENKVLSYEKVPVNRGMHTLKENSGKNSVQTITLKEVIENDFSMVDLLKIDIEGSEKYLLNKDNEAIFKQKVKYLAMEVHVDEHFTIANVESYFDSIGFRHKTFKSWTSINYLFYAENSNI